MVDTNVARIERRGGPDSPRRGRADASHSPRRRSETQPASGRGLVNRGTVAPTPTPALHCVSLSHKKMVTGHRGRSVSERVVDRHRYPHNCGNLLDHGRRGPRDDGGRPPLGRTDCGRVRVGFVGTALAGRQSLASPWDVIRSSVLHRTVTNYSPLRFVVVGWYAITTLRAGVLLPGDGDTDCSYLPTVRTVGASCACSVVVVHALRLPQSGRTVLCQDSCSYSSRRCSAVCSIASLHPHWRPRERVVKLFARNAIKR